MVIPPAAHTRRVLDRSDAALRGARPPSPWHAAQPQCSKHPSPLPISTRPRDGAALASGRLWSIEKPRRDICGRGKGRTMEIPSFYIARCNVAVTCLTSHAGTAAIIGLFHKTQLVKSYRSARWPHYLRGTEMVARVLELARAGERATEIVRKLTAEGRRFTYHGLNFCRLRCRRAVGSVRLGARARRRGTPLSCEAGPKPPENEGRNRVCAMRVRSRSGIWAVRVSCARDAMAPFRTDRTML
jgi:hypothetical protein